MENNIDNISVRSMVSVPELDLQKMSEDPSHMECEKCCGNCCWFCFEQTDGWGQCMLQDMCNSMHCSDLCTNSEYTSRERMRHYMAVLLQANRYRRDQHVPSIYKMPNPKELGKAIDFSVKYMKVFGKL